MDLSLFDYALPKERISIFPARRGESRLLALERKSGSVRHASFKEIGNFLEPGDLLVLNDTRVFPARVRTYRKTGGKVELLFLSFESKEGLYRATWQSSKSLHDSTVLFGPGETILEVVKLEGTLATFSVRLGQGFSTLREWLGVWGLPPLPPYLKRLPRGEDLTHYQTVYARSEGSIAAPTAGLHFSASLLEELEREGIQIVFVTLHVGLGTFQPVRAKDVSLHQMSAEWFSISENAAQKINRAKRVIAVGTSMVRALESAKKDAKGNVLACQGETSLFIYPGYRFKSVKGLITNFHYPKSTPLIMTAAFAGKEMLLKSYDDAIRLGYRMLSYGDAMFIL